MRVSCWLWILLAVACQGPISAPALVPVVVVGDGEHGVVLGEEVLACAVGPPAYGRAADREEWIALCQQFGGAFVARAHTQDDASQPQDFGTSQYIAVALPTAAALTGIVFGSEEGVDVVTLDVEPLDAVGHASQAACLLQLARRSCQLAVVVRNQVLGEEQFVAVFAGL